MGKLLELLPTLTALVPAQGRTLPALSVAAHEHLLKSKTPAPAPAVGPRKCLNFMFLCASCM